MPDNLPLVSICIPSYNCVSFIEKCIDSVFNQTYRNIELILSDDASTDGSQSAISDVLERSRCDIPTRYLEQKLNIGVEANWNFLLSLASGEYIKILPCDDYLHRECIEQQINGFVAHNNKPVLVFSAREIITSTGNHATNVTFYKDEIVSGRDLVLKSIINGTNIVGEPGAVLFRKDVSDKAGPFDGSRPYVIDFDYWNRLLAYGSGYGIRNVLCVFRIGANLSVRLGFIRVLNFCSFIMSVRTQWNINRAIIGYGILRASINEVFRRLFYLYCRIIN